MSDLPVVPKKSLGFSTRRPAVAVALLLMLGILLHDRLPMQPHRFLVAATVLFLIAGFVRRKIIAICCLSGLIIILGICVAQREHYQFQSNDIGAFATDEPHLTELQVRLIDDPQINTGPPGSQRLLPPKQTVRAEVQQIKTWTGWIAATGELPIEIEQIQPSLQAGQTVRMLGMLQRPRAAMNPGEFDWAKYYRQQRILAVFTVSRSGNIRIMSNGRFSCINWLRNKTRHALADGFTTQSSTQYALLDALVLGNRDPELRDIQDEFKQIGMGYQLNVSGMHIGLLAWSVFWCCRYMRLMPRNTLMITTAFVVLYATVSLPSHSGTRVAIVSIIVAVATYSSRSTDPKQLLALAIIAMLLWHPMDFYSLGFGLSFAVAIAFVLYLPKIQRWRQLRLNPDDVAKPETKGPSTLQKIRSRIWFALEAGTLAWLATLPLAAYFFGQTSPSAILGNLPMLPLVLLSLFSGVLKIFASLLWPRWSGIWAAIALRPVEWMQWFVHLQATIPAHSITLSAPPSWLIIVYYLLLVVPLFSFKWGWILRLVPLIGVFALICWPLFHQTSSTNPGELKLTLLSLGAGQCAVVEIPGESPVIFDAGSTTVSDVAQKIVEPFLRAEGDTQINEIFLSHGDFDHISAAGELTAGYNVHQVYTSYHFIKNSAGNIPDQVLLDELEKLNRTPKEIAIGDHFDLGNGAAVDVLWPPKAGDLNSNNAGLVLRLSYAGRSILFPADIQDPAFTGVLKNAEALASDVLIAPHHGSSEELTPAFLAAVHPQIILSSNFGRLTSKQRRFETMTDHVPLYRTPECGAITVTISKEGQISVSTYVKNAKPK
jgi:competence protein ComEC